MDNNSNNEKQDRRKTSPIRGGKGRPKPGAGRRYEKNEPASSTSRAVSKGVRSLFMEFENAAEQRIRRVIEEEMSDAEQRILRRLTGRRESGKRTKEAA